MPTPLPVLRPKCLCQSLAGRFTHVKELIIEAQAAGSVRLFSVRHEFPAEWAKFQSQVSVSSQCFELTLNLCPEHYPFWSHGRLKSVVRVDILARSAKVPVPASLDVFKNADTDDETKDALAKDTATGNLLVGKLTNNGVGLPAEPEGVLKLFFDDREMIDLWIAVTWASE